MQINCVFTCDKHSFHPMFMKTVIHSDNYNTIIDEIQIEWSWENEFDLNF